MRKSVLLLLACAALTSSCAKITLAWADLKPDGEAATPAVFEQDGNESVIANVEDWRSTQVPQLRSLLEEYVYGEMPEAYEVSVAGKKLLDEAAFSNAGRLVEYKLNAKVSFGDGMNDVDEFYMDVVMPNGDPDAPIILMQTFCPRFETLPHPAIHRPEGAGGCGGGAFVTGLMKYIFGRHIATPPIEEILQRGYGVATIFPSEFAPDSRENGPLALAAMAAGLDKNASRWGAIAAWAWGFSLMIDALDADGEITSKEYIAWGHSRYGKSALLAAAFDHRVSAVISHQSGTGGASLNRRKNGESVGEITRQYPHWFAERYSEYAGREHEMPVDQHHLLALIAPRPILLGNARRDVWSDPNGAFRAALGADPAYELFGVDGLVQERLDEWRPDAEIAFWLRPGTHGVVKEDWPAFLQFLDAHFPKTQDLGRDS